MTISALVEVNLGTVGREAPLVVAVEEGPFQAVALAGSTIPAERTDSDVVMMAVGSIPMATGAYSSTVGVG
jgi:hypothetical protein